jgi:hypothetical protein
MRVVMQSALLLSLYLATNSRAGVKSSDSDRQDNLAQVGFRLDQAVDDDVHSFHVLVWRSGAGPAEVRVIDGQNSKTAERTGPGQGKELGHRAFQNRSVPEVSNQVVVTLLHPGTQSGCLQGAVRTLF